MLIDVVKERRTEMYRETPYTKEMLAQVRGKLGGAVIIRADNVAEYLFQGTAQEEWNCLTDFPNVAPPFPRMWIEWEVPDWVNGGGEKKEMKAGGMRMGIFVEAEERGEAQDNGQGVRWKLTMTYVSTWKGKVVASAIETIFLVDGEGKIVDTGRRTGDGTPIPYEMRSADPQAKMLPGAVFFVPLLTLCFMHCKNVERVVGVPDKEGEKVRKRMGKEPSMRFYTLEIDPMRKVLRREGQSETVGLKRALSICRGHFKTFDEKRPLFGKITGTFFWHDHVRGSAEAGTIQKDYAVLGKKEG